MQGGMEYFFVHSGAHNYLDSLISGCKYVANLSQFIFSLPPFRMHRRGIQIGEYVFTLGLYILVNDNVFGGGLIAEIY